MGVIVPNSFYALNSVGVQSNGDGANISPRAGRQGDLIVGHGHARHYEAAYRSKLFSTGKTVSALSATTIALDATSTPIVGVWNPSTSTVNLAILEAGMVVYPNTLTTPVGPGAFVWASSVGNTAISTGIAPFHRKTLAAAGSQAKGFNPAVALTGITNNLVIFEGAEFSTPGPATFSTTTAEFFGLGGVQIFDGSLIVPPGGVLALLNTTSTTTHSIVCRLLWEEVDV